MPRPDQPDLSLLPDSSGGLGTSPGEGDPSPPLPPEETSSAPQRCTRCILPATFPGIRFDDQGVCQVCRQMPHAAERAREKARIQERFEELVDAVRTRPGVHCLVNLSGNRDSTYTLWLLKKHYGLQTLAFTFDNSFVSPETLKNVRLVAENLGSDHLIVKPRVDLLHRLFVTAMRPGMYPLRALKRSSSICHTCIRLAKGLTLRTALEKNIPLVAYGWSPGEVPLSMALTHTDRRMIETMTAVSLARFRDANGDGMAAYFPDQALLEATGEFPYTVSPLAFLPYDKDEVLHTVDKLAWAPPGNGNPNSSDCMLSGLANSVHVAQMGFHPYVTDFARLVREGHMHREEALARLQAKPAPEVIAAVEAKLGLHPRQRISWQ